MSLKISHNILFMKGILKKFNLSGRYGDGVNCLEKEQKRWICLNFRQIGAKLFETGHAWRYGGKDHGRTACRSGDRAVAVIIRNSFK